MCGYPDQTGEISRSCISFTNEKECEARGDVGASNQYFEVCSWSGSCFAEIAKHSSIDEKHKDGCRGELVRGQEMSQTMRLGMQDLSMNFLHTSLTNSGVSANIKIAPGDNANKLFDRRRLSQTTDDGSVFSGSLRGGENGSEVAEYRRLENENLPCLAGARVYDGSRLTQVVATFDPQPSLVYTMQGNGKTSAVKDITPCPVAGNGGGNSGRSDYVDPVCKGNTCSEIETEPVSVTLYPVSFLPIKSCYSTFLILHLILIGIYS
jgi:hypothetical protein